MSGNSATMPPDFAYKWEPVGAGFLCAFCPSQVFQKHAWRAYSEKYGQAYVCPRHLYHIQKGFRGEAHAVWLAIRAANMKSFRERHDTLSAVREVIEHE